MPTERIIRDLDDRVIVMSEHKCCEDNCPIKKRLEIHGNSFRGEGKVRLILSQENIDALKEFFDE